MLKVIITDYEYEDIEVEKRIFAKAGIQLVEGKQWKTPDQLIPQVAEADGIITQYADISREVIEAMNHCRIIIKYGIGINNIDVKAATEKQIYVCNIPDYGVDEVTNQAIAFMLALMRKLYITDRALRRGVWDYKKLIPIQRFEHSTVGIVGFGRMGQEVARKLKPFHINVIAFDPDFNKEVGEKLKVKQVDFDTLLSQSDFVTIHCPATEENSGMFNETAFNKMKKTAYVINTARGTVIEQSDLVKALKEKKIAGAGIDVFQVEPIEKDNPLLNLENVILSGHSSWYSEMAIANLHKKAAEEVIRVLQGKKPYNLCNKEVLLNKNSEK